MGGDVMGGDVMGGDVMGGDIVELVRPRKSCDRVLTTVSS